MAVRLSALLEAWREDPRPEATIDLCNLLIRALSKQNPKGPGVDLNPVVEFCQEAVERAGQNVEVILVIARLLIRTGDLDRAERMLAKLVEFAPGEARYYKLMGEIRLHRGDVPGADRFFAQAAALKKGIPLGQVQAMHGGGGGGGQATAVRPPGPVPAAGSGVPPPRPSSPAAPVRPSAPVPPARPSSPSSAPQPAPTMASARPGAPPPPASRPGAAGPPGRPAAPARPSEIGPGGRPLIAPGAPPVVSSGPSTQISPAGSPFGGPTTPGLSWSTLAAMSTAQAPGMAQAVVEPPASGPHRADSAVVQVPPAPGIDGASGRPAIRAHELLEDEDALTSITSMDQMAELLRQYGHDIVEDNDAADSNMEWGVDSDGQATLYRKGDAAQAALGERAIPDLGDRDQQDHDNTFSRVIQALWPSAAPPPLTSAHGPAGQPPPHADMNALREQFLERAKQAERDALWAGVTKVAPSRDGDAQPGFSPQLSSARPVPPAYSEAPVIEAQEVEPDEEVDDDGYGAIPYGPGPAGQPRQQAGFDPDQMIDELLQQRAEGPAADAWPPAMPAQPNPWGAPPQQAQAAPFSPNAGAWPDPARQGTERLYVAPGADPARTTHVEPWVGNAMSRTQPLAAMAPSPAMMTGAAPSFAPPSGVPRSPFDGPAPVTPVPPPVIPTPSTSAPAVAPSMAPPRSGFVAPEPPRRKRRWLLALFAVVLAVGAGVGVGGLVEFRTRGTVVTPRRPASELLGVVLTAQVDGTLARGGPADLAAAEQLLARAKEIAPGKYTSLASVRERVLSALDVDPAQPGLSSAMTDARSHGATDGELAFATMAEQLVKGDTKAALKVLAKNDAEPERKDDAYFQLVAGAVLEATGDPNGLKRYRASIEGQPRLFAADMRLVRALLLYGDTAEGRRRAGELRSRGDAESRVLTELAKFRERPAAGTSASAPASASAAPSAAPAPVASTAPPATSPPGKAYPLARAVRALGLLVDATSNPAGQNVALRVALKDADVAFVASFCAELALSLNEPGIAREAVARSLEMAPGSAAVLAMQARVLLFDGDLARMKEAAEKLTPADGALLGGLVAYEYGDLSKLMSLEKAAGASAASFLTPARTRIQGAQPLTGDVIAGLSRPEVVGGDLIAADVALDAGDLDAARRVLDRWPAKHGFFAARRARLARYEGKLDDARTALASAVPTKTAVIERLLLDAETKPDRAAPPLPPDEKLEPERRWLEAYRDLRQGGDPVAARRVLASMKVPDDGAPLTARLAAALALGAAGDRTRAIGLTRPVLTAWPQNPDAIRAAVDSGLLPRTALGTLPSAGR